MSWSDFGKECVTEGFDITSFVTEECGPRPVLLDVGSALSYAFGNLIGGEPVEVRYIDPLAPFYNRMLRRYKVDRPEITFGMAEYLTATVATPADFIHIRNALDHSANPLQGIIQALGVLRVGGVLYLNHFNNEAERERYRGFHQYNITCRSGRLVIWNRTEPEAVVDEILAPYASVETSVTPQGRVIAVIRKKGALPPSMVDMQRTAAGLANLAIAIAQQHHSLREGLIYQMLRLYTSVLHVMGRALPIKVHTPLHGLIKKQ